MDSGVARLERDIEALNIRIRDVETANSPYAQQMLGEFRALQSKVAEYAEQGTPVSRRELKHVEREIDRIDRELGTKADAKDVKAIEDETRSNRTMVRSAFFAGIASLCVAIIVWLLNQGKPT